MRKSRFSASEKLRIIREKESSGVVVEEICLKYRISMPTYYKWKRELNYAPKIVDTEHSDLGLENKTLRRLYIDLSEHNYKLAQFLSK